MNNGLGGISTKTCDFLLFCIIFGVLDILSMMGRCWYANEGQLLFAVVEWNKEKRRADTVRAFPHMVT